jgi:hypothetical protein
MSDILLGIHVSVEERDRIHGLARQRGFNELDAYLRSLIESDAKAQGETLVLNYDDDEREEDPKSAFKEAWHQAMTGQHRPIQHLWDELDDE